MFIHTLNKFSHESFLIKTTNTDGFQYWTANDHSPKVKDIICQDLRSLSFYFFVCPRSARHRLITQLVDPYLGSIYEQLDAAIFFTKASLIR